MVVVVVFVGSALLGSGLCRRGPSEIGRRCRRSIGRHQGPGTVKRESPTYPAPRESDASTSPTASPASRIETTSLTYFGRPFETIQIQGQYGEYPVPRRVQIQQPRGWAQYPLPAVTQPSGDSCVCRARRARRVSSSHR